MLFQSAHAKQFAFYIVCAQDDDDDDESERRLCAHASVVAALAIAQARYDADPESNFGNDAARLNGLLLRSTARQAIADHFRAPTFTVGPPDDETLRRAASCVAVTRAEFRRQVAAGEWTHGGVFAGDERGDIVRVDDPADEHTLTEDEIVDSEDDDSQQ